MPATIIATGDIHIGKKSSGIPSDKEELSTKHTWNQLVETAIREKADALVLTGDIVDRDNRFFEASGPLQAGFHKLNKAGVKVVMVAGNHDYDVLNQLVNAEKYENLWMLGSNDQWEEITLQLNGQSVRFVGWSFTKRFVHTDPLLKLSVSESDFPTVGLLHTELDTPESRYAPVKSDNFLNHPVDAWLLGHIHKPEIIRHIAPFIAYPGSPHALNPKEPGIHGALRITIESKNNIQVETIPLSPVHYETLDIDISNAGDEAQLRKKVMDEIFRVKNKIMSEMSNIRFLVFDLHLCGEHPDTRKIEIWMNGIDDFGTDEEVLAVVRKVAYNIRPVVENMEKLSAELSPAGLLAQTILAIERNESTPFLEKLLEKWKNEVDKINNTPTFYQLKKNQKTLYAEDNAAKKEILAECKKSLGELLNQKPND